jgi:predicted ATP-binding protein involved in virulence
LPTIPDDDPAGVPLAALFSTARAVPKRRGSVAQSAPAGVDAALAGALSSRELRLDQFVSWIQALGALGHEHPIARGVLDAVQDAVACFLPNYQNLRLEGEGRTSLMIDRDGATLPVHLLSDGERGVLSLVLDLTRRLSWANPDLLDPVAETEAVVLVDELELHLHPKWQRQIVHRLQATFPRCQFIATTHSPQIIGELEHDRIHVMDGGEVYSPTHSFGVDSSRVLEEVMAADSRNQEVQGLLSQISNEIGKNRFADARQLIERLVERVGENDPEVTRLRTLLDFLEGEE